MTNILHRLCFVDIETTGLDPHTAEIIEIATVFVEHGAITNRRSWLVRPTSVIPPFITALTGLSDDEVRAAPRLEDIDADFRAAIEGWTVVAHNAMFERAFLGERLGNSPVLDSCEVAQLLFPERPSHALDALVRWLKVGRAARHRALDDAEDTFLVLEAMCRRVLEETDRARLNQLLFHLGRGTDERGALRSLLEALKDSPTLEKASKSEAELFWLESEKRMAEHLTRTLLAPKSVSTELEEKLRLPIALEAARKAAQKMGQQVAVAVSRATLLNAHSEMVAMPALAQNAVCSTWLSRALEQRGADEAQRFGRAYLASWLGRTPTGDIEEVSRFVRSRSGEVALLTEAALECRCAEGGCLSKRQLRLQNEPCVVVTHEHALHWLALAKPISVLFLEGERLPDAELRRTQKKLEVAQLAQFEELQPLIAKLRTALAALPPGAVSARARAGQQWVELREVMTGIYQALVALPLGAQRDRLLKRIVEVMEPPLAGFEVHCSPTGLGRVASRPGERIARRLTGGHCLVSSCEGGLRWTKTIPIIGRPKNVPSVVGWVPGATSLAELASLLAAETPVVLVAPAPLGPIAEACRQHGLSTSLDMATHSAVHLCEWRRDRPLPAGHTCVFYGVREWRRAVLASNARRVMLVSPSGLASEPVRLALRGLEPRLLA